MDETEHKEQVQEEYNEQTQKNEECRGNANGHSQRTRNSASNNKLQRNRSRIHVTSQERQNRHSHSRSRSPQNTKNNRKWISSNAFINFIQDFRQVIKQIERLLVYLFIKTQAHLQNFAGERSTKIYQMAGKTWRAMSPAQKQPYVNAALSIKNKRQIQQNVENVQKPDTKTKENAKDADIDEQEKVTKNERKKRNSNISTRKKTKSESDSDSVTSATTGSNTTDDFSEDSS